MQKSIQQFLLLKQLFEAVGVPGAGLVSGLEVSVFLGTPLQHSLGAGPKVELGAWPKVEP